MSRPVQFEIATAGRPVEALARAAGQWVVPGTTYWIAVAHDEGCPCTSAGAPMPWCTCEVVELTIARATSVAA